MGRLPGDYLSTTPLDYNAWWVRPGQAFVSHPLANGDVAWEAVVSTAELQARGYRWAACGGRRLACGAGVCGWGLGWRGQSVKSADIV